ncbi:MHS family MFS transporter [Nakamurella flava]|uniref:MHS family MFS transporter n=1 Tax=Nakamurella flava TaxID=2576308 RepID=A0A4U6Q946_9ACTN|nr:MFS transporter [Nakamurella flava]TKV56392.1 MHS family MFS transporter [Nakamurella flava]
MTNSGSDRHPEDHPQRRLDDRDRAHVARRAAWGSATGTMLEWYDFGIYGVIAALVLNGAFFPALDPAVGTIAAFSTVAVGFVARPIGAILFGHLGDRVGRRSVLIATLVMTGVVTILIGLLPTYAEIGIAAPILLVTLRFLQGVGLGGEFGGAVLLSTEHAPEGRRSFYGGIMAMGVPLGVLLSNVVFLVITLFVPMDAFQAWGWRLPFLGSVVILAVGLWIRVRVPESPQFAELKRSAELPGEQQHARRAPLTELLATRPVTVLWALLVIVGSSAIAYTCLTFVLSWGKAVVGYNTPQLLGAICLGAITWALTAPVWATRGDRPGGMRHLFIGWGVVRTVSIVPFFLVLATGSVPLLYVAMAVMGVIISATQVPAGAAISSLFPVEVRYTGTSFAYQVGAILGGGVTPLVAASLMVTSSGIMGVAAYVTAVSLLSTAAGLVFRRSSVPGRTPDATPQPSGAARSAR